MSFDPVFEWATLNLLCSLLLLLSLYIYFLLHNRRSKLSEEGFNNPQLILVSIEDSTSKKKRKLFQKDANLNINDNSNNNNNNHNNNNNIYKEEHTLILGNRLSRHAREIERSLAVGKSHVLSHLILNGNYLFVHRETFIYIYQISYIIGIEI